MNNEDKFISLIKSKIEKYTKKANFEENGYVISVSDGVAIVSGLDDAMYNEIVEFENGSKGIIMNLEISSISVIVLGKYDDIKERSLVKRIKSVFSAPVGDSLMGRVIDAIGNPIDGNGSINKKTFSPVEKIAPGVTQREPVNAPLETGILLIDSLLPIGKGQRELIIGDRQTGKTSIAIDTIINQKGKNVKCIYVSIGQKNSSLARIIKNLETSKAMKYTTVVSASAGENDAVKYLAPYTGITIGEKWLENGENVLIIFDDLTKHAYAYRALSLLLGRPVGREAYPGDIFYLHSRLLERACKLDKKHGGGSITALPIIETQNGDLSSYIPTNAISITDGQIFLQTNLFNLGQRPAVSVELSVSRVGSAAQNKVIKKFSSSIKAKLSEYYDVASFAQFGNELDENTNQIIEFGKRIVQLMKQNNNHCYDWIEEAILLHLIYTKNISFINIHEIDEFKNKYLLVMIITNEWKEISKKIDVSDNILNKLNEISLSFILNYIKKQNSYDAKVIKLVEEKIKKNGGNK
ncbi:MAG: F0F1 ATP synthase subunit alpha [Mycoplasmataceae bacterium]|nr:F0F1 ATP synthase subunit alpha [Mycoplasmataceae bacterium]